MKRAGRFATHLLFGVRDAAEGMSRRTMAILAGVLVLAVLAGSALWQLVFAQSTYRITVQFRSTPGLYADNAVDVMGVPVGKVASVKPGPDYVTVVLALPTSVKIPADAAAVIMAPNPVSDRFVALSPAYTGGPALQAGALIPLSRSLVPLEIDQVYSAVDNLATTLGPSGANDGGQLSAALHAIAQLADGRGTDVHQAITAISNALPALTKDPKALQTLLTGLDRLTKTLVARNDTINQLYGDLAGAVSDLSSERTVLASAVSNLQSGLAAVVSFIKANQANLGSSLTDLASTMKAVMTEEDALRKTFDTAALGFQNFNNAITPNGSCLTGDGSPHNCPGLWARLDLSSNVWDTIKTYCGSTVASPMLPILQANAKLGPARAKDTDCGALIGLDQNDPGPPGSPKAPDLDLAHFLGPRS